jgi:hypothetical protein
MGTLVFEEDYTGLFKMNEMITISEITEIEQ